MRIQFFLEELEDEYARDNLKRLQDAILKEPILNSDFKFYEITVPTSVVEYEYLHHLKFVPKDIIVTNVSNNADATFHYDQFTNTNLVFTTTAACTIRAFVGTYRGGV